MCGPLAYIVLSQSSSKHPAPNNPFISHLIYNIARIFSFTAIGTLAGTFGLGLLTFLQLPPIKFFPWIIVIFFIIVGLGFDRLIPKAPFAKRIFAHLSERLTQIPKTYAAILLGLATPFLPCGPLYIVFWVALLSGSPLFGAEISFGFAIGTLPIMLLTSSQFPRLKQFLHPKALHLTQRLVALTAAFLLSWRLLSVDSPLTASFCCPW